MTPQLGDSSDPTPESGHMLAARTPGIANLGNEIAEAGRTPMVDGNSLANPTPGFGPPTGRGPTTTPAFGGPFGTTPALVEGRVDSGGGAGLVGGMTPGLGLGTPGAAMTPLLHPSVGGGDLGHDGVGEAELWAGVLVSVEGGEGPVVATHPDGTMAVDGP